MNNAPLFSAKAFFEKREANTKNNNKTQSTSFINAAGLCLENKIIKRSQEAALSEGDRLGFTAGESTITNGFHGSRNSDRCDLSKVLECPLANSGHALRNGHGCGIFTDASIPGSVRIGIIILHGTGAGDGKGFGYFIIGPDDALLAALVGSRTAIAAGNAAIIAFAIGKALMGAICTADGTLVVYKVVSTCFDNFFPFFVGLLLFSFFSCRGAFFSPFSFLEGSFPSCSFFSFR